MNNPIVVFDGICNLCNATIDFLMRNDRSGILRFTSFQGRGADILCEFGIFESPITIYVIHDGVLYTESEAILYLTRFLRFPYQLIWYFKKAGLLTFAPLIMRNAIYRLISRNRYRWFGKRHTCRVPSDNELGRFL